MWCSESDPIMAESLSEVSNNVDVVEASDEDRCLKQKAAMQYTLMKSGGKKKSKFKVLKSFFVKKKKRETEGAQEERMLMTSLSSSSINISTLDLVQKDELTDPRSKSGMGNKALSHESIFTLDTEPERSARELGPATEFQRSKSLGRSQAFRTLPRSGTMSGSMPRFTPRSGGWVAGSKLTEIPPLRPRQPSLSPPLFRSDKISKNLEDISIDDESPKGPQMKGSFEKTLTANTSFSDSSSESDYSQPSTECAPTLATNQSCLDSLATQHKTDLNLWELQKKSLQATVEPNQEEPNVSVVSEGAHSPTEAEETGPKKVKIESADSSGQEQSDSSGTYDQKTRNKTKKPNAPGNLRNSMSAAYGRRRKRTGTCVSITNEYGSKGKSIIQFSKSHDPNNQAVSSSTNETTRHGPSWYLPLEKQVTEQLATSEADITTPLELLSDKTDMKRRDAGGDFEAKKAQLTVEEDMQKSMVSGPQPYHEDGATVAQKTESKIVLPVVGTPSTTQKETIILITTEAQVLRDPSPIQSEDEEASSFGLQNSHSETENVPIVCKEKPLVNVPQACTVSVSETTNTTVEEGGISMGNAETANVSPDSRSMLEKGNDSEKQLATEHSFESSKKPKDEQKDIQKFKDVAVDLSCAEEQLALGYSSQFLRESEAEKSSSETESPADRESSLKEVDPTNSSPSGESKGIFSESESFLEEQLAPRCPSEELLVPENKEISTESNSSVTNSDNAEEWPSSEEGLPHEYPNQVLEKPEDEQEVPSVPENVSEEQMPSQCPTQSIVRPIVQQHTSSTSVSVCEGQLGSVEPVTPSHPFQPWVNSKVMQLVSADHESATERGSFMEPLPHKMTSNYLMNPKAEEKSSSGPGITSMEEVSMAVLPPRYSQPLTRAIVAQEASAYPESAPVEQRIYVALRHPSHTFPQWVSPQVEQVFSSPESQVIEEGGIFVEPLLPGHLPQPLMSCIVQQSLSLGSENIASEVISVEPRYSKYSLTNPQIQPIYSDSTAVEQGIFVEQLPLGCHYHPLVKPKFQPHMSLDSESTSAQWCGAVESVPARHTCKTWMGPECKQQDSVSPQNTEAEWEDSKESALPRHHVQPWLKPTFEQVTGLENSAIEWSISVDPQPSRVTSQPLKRSVIKQPVSTGSGSTSGQWSGYDEQMSPRHPFQPWASSTLQQQVSVDQESTATEGRISVDVEPSIYYSQPLVRPKLKQEISDSMNASEEWGAPMASGLSRPPFQLWVNPKFEQQVSAGPESVAIERDIHRELPRHLSQTTMRQKVQKTSSSSESATVERGISEESLSPKHSTYLLVRSKVQEIPSILENTADKASLSKKLLLPKNPPHSYVKFMAQQIFSENPDTEREMYVDPLAPNLPSKTLLKPEVECQIFSDWENADSEKNISLKHALKSLGGPADLQEGLSLSERAPKKWSHSRWQIPSRKALEKFKYKQEFSVSDSSSEEWRSSEEQLPSRYPSKALHGSEFLPPTVLMNVPVEWSTLTEDQPHPSQAFGSAEYQQQVSSSFKNAAAQGIIVENSPRALSLPKDPVSPKKAKKHSQGSEDFTKRMSTSSTKSEKIIFAPTWKVPISVDTYYKEEIHPSGDGNNGGHVNLPTNEANTGNLSGAQLKRMSSPHKYKSEKPNRFSQIPSFLISSSGSREQQINRDASKGFPNTIDSPTAPSAFVEKRHRGKYEGMARKHPIYKPPGESGRQLDYYVSDSAWFTMARQKHKGSQLYIPAKDTKTKSKAAAKTDAKEPIRGIRPEATHRILQKGSDPVNENRPKKILISSIHKQEKAQAKPSKPIKSVVFEDQKMLPTSGMGKEMKRSLSLPSGLQYLDDPVKSNDSSEPVWFSIAKKKAKAWSHIAEVMP
ncbi:acrosomal protein KIAA1210 homolog isoform X1 [Octodon degus]|uniref:Acrosomal protein KIAA1210 homolog isoform X1 n=2 Tax=Octodon degus TaxID=10160 RepID=A0A6P6DP97_OCTDE|nr:acrosomal protein KIAA1210 homolog isoform X1 [Octodon degus]XP_023561787.1 acrosomal protein KIAA1210 homolog isoform X1 [Octodon degus]XP_023561788.1 acrosomal protein KIAA1210 homolog isoform X1 [Octodon degus]